MQIIIEGYQYPAGAVDRVLWEGAFQTVDGKVSIGYVGYYWNDRLNDSVFVLPKVFLEPDAQGQDLVFGKYRPEDVIDVANKKFTKAERRSIWRSSTAKRRSVGLQRQARRSTWSGKAD